MMTKHLRTVFLGGLLFLLTAASAQVEMDAWQLIQQNDFKQAKLSFEKILKQDPKNEDALCGLIFLAETVKDYDTYIKYVKQLVEADWNPHYFQLFKHVYDYDDQPEQYLNKGLFPADEVSLQLAIADSLFRTRDFAGSEAVKRAVVGDYNWSFIGPFRNVAGSGFLRAYEVEQEAFLADKTYPSGDGNDLVWVNRELRPKNGVVEFSRILPNANGGTCFANTFLTVPTDRELQIRIARNNPLKIWLDDQLVFANDENIACRWDAEWVNLSLKAGTHRLLVKSTSYETPDNKSTVRLDFQDAYHQEEESFSTRRGNSSWSNELGSYNRQNLLFSLRLTDTQGKVYEDIASAFAGKYAAQNYSPTLHEEQLIQHFKKQIAKQPKDAKQYYLLAKAYLRMLQQEQGEAYFFDVLEKNKTLVFYRYLMAKFYAANDKGDKAEGLISGLDNEKTPIFEIMSAQLDKIDKEKNAEAYLKTLDELLVVSPTNLGVVNDYISYYNEKGEQELKKKFIKAFLVKHSEEKYKDLLEPYLEDDSYKPSSYKRESDKERAKWAKKALKRKKKRFSYSDYNQLIRYYKSKDKNKEVLKLYDELKSILPHNIYARTGKADYLFENDQQELALAELEEIVRYFPYHEASIETIGDIYLERGEKEKALAEYKKAEKIVSQKDSYYNDLEKKIEKLEGKTNYKQFFNSRSYDAVMADSSWKAKYQEEESVILMYAIETTLNEENYWEDNQRMVVKILNDAGAKFWTEANFRHLGRLSFAKVIKADGTVTSPNINYGYAVFKNLEAGDIIQIEGNSSGKVKQELPQQFFDIVTFSFGVPVYNASMDFLVPKGKKIYYNCNRLSCEPKVENLENHDLYRWSKKELPKYENEEAILNNLDAYAWIMLSTLSDWSSVVDWYLEKTYKRLEANYEIEAVLADLVTKEMSKAEKVEKIYNYVTEEITYSFVNFLNSNYIPKTPAATVAGRIGDCKDVASLMITMLRKADIEAYYVLVRTTNYTHKKPTATNMVFNHVIVGYVLEDGKMQYMDLTTDYYPHQVTPEFDGDAWALLIKAGENDVFQLPNDLINPLKSELSLHIKANLKADRSLDMEVSTEALGVVGGKIRESLNRQTTETDRTKYIAEYFGEGSFDHLVINDFEFEKLDAIEASLKGSMKMKAYNHLEKLSSFYIIQIPFLKTITTQPSLFLEDRYADLDLMRLFEIAPCTQKIELSIPAKFQVMELPPAIEIHNKFGDFELSFKKTKNGIEVNRKIVFKTRIVQPEDYQAFKTFYLQLLEADRTKIGLRG